MRWRLALWCRTSSTHLRDIAGVYVNPAHNVILAKAGRSDVSVQRQLDQLRTGFRPSPECDVQRGETGIVRGGYQPLGLTHL
jgi:hypothetical protein